MKVALPVADTDIKSGSSKRRIPTIDTEPRPNKNGIVDLPTKNIYTEKKGGPLDDGKRCKKNYCTDEIETQRSHDRGKTVGGIHL